LTGQRIFYIHDLHQKYGPVVRIDTHEVNVCDSEAFSEVHRIGSGFTKAAWYDRATYGIEGNVFVMTNVREHAARRRLLARPFSRSSLVMNFQSLVTDRSRMAVANIKREVSLGDCDVMKWWTLMATDVVAQVAFGEESYLLEIGEVSNLLNILYNSQEAELLCLFSLN
jgi:cytochrome P450